MTTANCGTADSGLSPAIPGSNVGSVFTGHNAGTAGAGNQPASGGGNVGSVFPPPGSPVLAIVPPAINPLVGIRLTAANVSVVLVG